MEEKKDFGSMLITVIVVPLFAIAWLIGWCGNWYREYTGLDTGSE